MQDQHYSIVNKWIDNSYLEEEVEIDFKSDGRHFLTYFYFVKEDALTTKFCLVVNGAKKYKDVSINDCILSGENLMNRLSILLLRFRKYPYVLSCDIQRMFLRIRLQRIDQSYVKMLLRTEHGGPLKVYRCTRHMFGLTSSPHIAMRVTHHHVEQMADTSTT